jgi:hypothetical protein
MKNDKIVELAERTGEVWHKHDNGATMFTFSEDEMSKFVDLVEMQLVKEDKEALDFVKDHFKFVSIK